MSDVRIMDEIGKEIAQGMWYENLGPVEIADRILSIPAIKEAIAFHESCKSAFAVNGEFVVTEENLAGKPDWGEIRAK